MVSWDRSMATPERPRCRWFYSHVSLPKYLRLDYLTQKATFCDMSTMTMRVDRQNVKAAKKILAGMGLTPRTAIDAFLAKVVSQKAIPFPLAMPDSEYAKVEYNMTPADLTVFDRRMDLMVAAEKKSGTIKSVTSIASRCE